MRYWRILLCVSLSTSAMACSSTCPPISGEDSVLKAGAHIVLGEVHGNAETPRLAATLACRAASHGAVRVALEIWATEQPQIDAYLASGNRAALLAGAFWTDAFQDGRRSEAIVGLLDELRALRGRGLDVKVVAFDERGADEREEAMASRLAAAFAADPRATFLILVGNLHARKSASQWAPNPMAARLVARHLAVITLEAHYGEGSSWTCSGSEPDSCQPVPIGDEQVRSSRLVLQKTRDGAFDGQFEIPRPTFSPPAVVPLTEHQRRGAQQLRLAVQAKQDYLAKRYSECAMEYASLGLQNDVRVDLRYNSACCYALAGSSEEAFAALSWAAQGGFSDAKGAETDPDLASLRRDPRWGPILNRFRARAQTTSRQDNTLRQTLLRMRDDDQREATLALEGHTPGGHASERVALLRQIIAEHGWPRISLVGADGSAAAWVIAQHADDDLAFQRECLVLLEQAFAVDEAGGFELAYLTDRVLTAEGKPQRYGTQGSPQYTEAQRREVDERRRSIGLPTMAEMARIRGGMYERIRRAP